MKYEPPDTAKVMVFTQFTDTMDFLRDQLRTKPGLKMVCYSGRGGDCRIVALI